MATADKAIIFSVASPSGAPAWFTGQTDGTWKAIADGTGVGATGGNKLTSAGVQASPTVNVTYPGPPGNPGGTWGWSNNYSTALTNSWTSAYYDPDNNEYGFCANGGHADYAGNETYAVAMRAATPAWRRLNTPTPGSIIDATGDALASGGDGKFSDGRSRAMHNSFQVYAFGRVWMPYQNSLTSADGGGNKQACSYNRAALGAALTPVDYANSDKWEFHGWNSVLTYDASIFKFGSACLDKVGKRVYAAGGEGANNQPYWYVDVDPASSTFKQLTGFQTGASGFGQIYGMACAHNVTPRIVLGYCTFSERFGYLNTTNLAAGWTIPTNIVGTKPQFGVLGPFNSTQQNMSVQYDAASFSFVFSDPYRFGRTLWRLQVPHTGGVFNPSGQWTWSNVTPSGPTIQTNPNGNTLVYQKVQYIEDMGNGQSALVTCCDTSGPTYVYKIPVGGLNF